MTPDCDIALRAVNYYVARAWRAASEADRANKDKYMMEAREALARCGEKNLFDLEHESRCIDQILSILDVMAVKRDNYLTTTIVNNTDKIVGDLEQLIGIDQLFDYRYIVYNSIRSEWRKIRLQEQDKNRTLFGNKIEKFSLLLRETSYSSANNCINDATTFYKDFSWSESPEWQDELDVCQKLLQICTDLENGNIENIDENFKKIPTCKNIHLAQLVVLLRQNASQLNHLKNMLNNLIQIMRIDPNQQIREELRRGEKIVKDINKSIKRYRMIKIESREIVDNWNIYADTVQAVYRYEYINNEAIEIWRLPYLFLDKYRNIWGKIYEYSQEYPTLSIYNQLQLDALTVYKKAEREALKTLDARDCGNIDALNDIYNDLSEKGYKIVPWLERIQTEGTDLIKVDTASPIKVNYIELNEALKELENIKKTHLEIDITSTLEEAQSFLDVNPDHSRVILENELEHVLLSDKLLARIQLFRDQELDPALRKYEKVKEFVEGAKIYRKQRQYEDAWRLLVEAEKVLPKAEILCSARDELIPYLRVHLGSLLRAVEMAWWEKKIDATEAIAQIEFLLQLPRVAEFFNDESKRAKKILAEIDSGTNLLVANRVKT